jgi:hypothetical protein
MKRNNRYTLALLLAIGLMAVAGFRTSAQKKLPEGCPTTKVICPSEVHKGDMLGFTANVKGGDEQVTPTYNWSVSAGQIESGQGTSKIEVSTSEVDVDSSITATVELGGYSRDCPYGSSAASATAIVIKK